MTEMELTSVYVAQSRLLWAEYDAATDPQEKLRLQDKWLVADFNEQVATVALFNGNMAKLDLIAKEFKAAQTEIEKTLARWKQDQATFDAFLQIVEWGLGKGTAVVKKAEDLNRQREVSERISFMRGFRGDSFVKEYLTNARTEPLVLENPSPEENCVLWAKDAVGAYLNGAELTIVARGVLPSASHSVRIVRDSSGLLEFTLLVCGPSDNPPSGMVEDFVQFASFFNVGRPERVSIRHAGGREKVPVVVEPILEPGPVPVEEDGPVHMLRASRDGRQLREAIGYSNAFDFGEAFQDAIDNLPPDSDDSTIDKLTQIEAVRIGAQFGGIVGFNRMFVVARDTSVSLGRGLQGFFAEREVADDGDASASSANEESESASIFEPSLSLVREDDGTYTLYAVTVTPDSCHRVTGTKEGVPSGYTTIREAVPVQLNIEKRQGICLNMLWPLFHKHTGIVLDEAHTSVIAFTVRDGEVVGQSSIDISAAIGALDFSKLDIAGF